MARVDIAYKEPYVQLDITRLRMVDGKYFQHAINSVSALEKIAKDCRVILDHPELWREQAEEMLRAENECLERSVVRTKSPL